MRRTKADAEVRDLQAGQLSRLAASSGIPPCAGDDRFASLDEYDHKAVRSACITCPRLRLCRDLAELEQYPTGTYGGLLYVNGVRREVTR